MRQQMVEYVHGLQDQICSVISQLDKNHFREDEWEREEGGGGRSRVFSNGEVFEKAGVNVSVVHGTLSLDAAEKMGGGHELKGQDLEFFATGISLVLHPKKSNGSNRACQLSLFRKRTGRKGRELVVRRRSRFDPLISF